VVKEVWGKKSDLKKWCDKQKQGGYVTSVTGEDKLAAAVINNQYPMIDPDTFKSTFDTYIIAHAKANEYGIVSDETRRKTINDLYKIPDVCEKFEIKTTRKPAVFFTAVGIKWSI